MRKNLSTSSSHMIYVTFAYFLAVALGVAAGYWGSESFMTGIKFLSTAFIKLFKFLSIPIIAVSIISSLSKLSQQQNSGKIFKHTIVYTLLTTILAACLAACLYAIFQPASVTPAAAAADITSQIPKRTYFDYIQDVIPDNFVTPFATANVLSVLLVSAAIGIAISKMPNQSKTQELMITFFSACQEVLFIMVNWLIVILPIGIFAFVASLTEEVTHGLNLGGLGTYFGIVIAANLIQMFIVLPAFLLLRGLNPLVVMKAMLPALSLAFFSKSSAATLPVTISSAEKRLGVKPEIAEFVLPLCTTINMNGCAAFIFLTVIYLMQNAGIPITAETMIVWIFIATIAAVGNAGVPMGCFFLSASLLASMDVPILLMGVILPFYTVVDMIETSLNVFSDSSVAAAVDHDLKKLEQS